MATALFEDFTVSDPFSALIFDGFIETISPLFGELKRYAALFTNKKSLFLSQAPCLILMQIQQEKQTWRLLWEHQHRPIDLLIELLIRTWKELSNENVPLE